MKKILTLLLVLCAAGLMLSSYAFHHHFDVKVNGTTDAVCNLSEKINCDTIAKSEFAEPFAGIPVAVHGIAYFLALFFVAALGLMRRGQRQSAFEFLALASIAGVVASGILAFVAISKIGAFCLVCAGVYIVILCMALTVFVYRSELEWQRNLFSQNRLFTIAVFAGVAFAIEVSYFSSADYIRRVYIESSRDLESLASANWRIWFGRTQVDMPVRFDGPIELQDRYIGNRGAKIILTVFVDYECPICADLHPNLELLSEDFPNDLLIVFKNLPLAKSCNKYLNEDIHSGACEYAVLAQCVGNDDNFKNFLNLVFEGGGASDKGYLQSWISKQSDATRVNECLSQSKALNKISDDVELAHEFGFTGTPGVVFNGRIYVGPRRYKHLKKTVIELLKL